MLDEKSVVETTPIKDFQHHKYQSEVNKEDPAQNADFTEFYQETEEFQKQFDQDADPNPFPLDTFPSPFAGIIKQLNQSLNFPVEFTSVAMMAAISVTVGKAARLRVKNGWLENAAFYFSIVGSAGSNKTHPLNFCLAPIQERDVQEVEDYAKRLAAFKAEQLENAKSATNASAKQEPKLIKTVLNNATPEVQDVRMADNPRGCILVVDELMSFLSGMNNYTKGDVCSKYLSIWSGQTMTVDRIKSPVPIVIKKPFLNIIGSIQPYMLPKAFSEDRLYNGFFNRFLFVTTTAIKQPISDTELDPAIAQVYCQWLDDCRMRYSEIEPTTFTWSPEAKKFFYEWQANNVEKVNANSDSLAGELYSKFDIHFCRFALILQIMKGDSNSSTISIDAAIGAARLCTYFSFNSESILNKMLDNDPIENLPADKKKIYHLLPEHFTTADALATANRLGYPERSLKRFLADKSLFTKTSHGQYSKAF